MAIFAVARDVDAEECMIKRTDNLKGNSVVSLTYHADCMGLRQLVFQLKPRNSTVVRNIGRLYLTPRRLCHDML